MTLTHHVIRSLRHFWRINLAVTLAAAVGVAVLTGSFLVGSSVRASLRALTLERLGPIDHALTSERFFQENLVEKFQQAAEQTRSDSGDSRPAACPAVFLKGSVVHTETEARTGQAQVVGVDRRFWRFMRSEKTPLPAPLADNALGLANTGPNDAILNEALAREIGAKLGDEILVRVQKPSAIGRETFLGERDETVATLRLRVALVLDSGSLGRLSLEPSQHQPLNVFVPLSTLQRRIDREEKVNVILAVDAQTSPTGLLAGVFELADLGIEVKYKTRGLTDEDSANLQLSKGRPGYLVLQTSRIFLDPYLADLAVEVADDLGEEHGFKAERTLVYLANEIRVGNNAIPYSVVAGKEEDTFGPGPPERIQLNLFAAADLQVRMGAAVALKYYVPGPRGKLVEETTTLTLSGVTGEFESDLTPDFPGLSDAGNLADWDPPFPLDTSRIRPVDEEYWDKHHAAPKAFVPLETARKLWGNRYGDLTSIRLVPTDPSIPMVPAGLSEEEAAAFWEKNVLSVHEKRKEAFSKELRRRLDLARMGFDFMPVKEHGLDASKGASDFGGLFFGFSLFILVSAAMLIQILFRLGVEGRSREYGLLSAVGFSPKRIRRLMLAEGAILATAGGAVGLLLSIAYGKLMVHGLNTWWVGSIGSPFVRFSLSPAALAGGFAGGWFVAMFTIFLAARRLSRLPARSLLAGHFEAPQSIAGKKRKSPRLAIVSTGLGLLLLLVSPSQTAQVQTLLFFAVGALLLVGSLAFFAAYLKGGPAVASPERFTLMRLGMSASKRRPGRNVLVSALVATATFLIVAVGANRQVVTDGRDKHSGTGGYSLLAESALPIYQFEEIEGVTVLDEKAAPPVPSQAQAQDTASGKTTTTTKAAIHLLRVRDGDDASCRNLYQAGEPRILGLSDSFVDRGGFHFAGSEADDPETRANPWLLLRRPLADGAVPVIGDYTTVVWLLHKGLGKELTVDGHRLRIVALLHKSAYQSELLMSSENFTRLFPNESGYRSFAIETFGEDAPAVAAALESALEQYGFDAVGAVDKLNALLTVENTYLATFQSLGGLGLLLGTLGLALALLRNLLERRREFALLRALGFRFKTLLWLAVSENLLLLAVGVFSGALCALLAIAPALITRSAQPDWPALLLTLAAIFLFGLAAAVLSAAAVLRAPVLQALREE